MKVYKNVMNADQIKKKSTMKINKDNIFLSFIYILGLISPIFPYNNALSIIFQFVIVLVIMVFYNEKTYLFIPVMLVLKITQSKINGTIHIESPQHYAINNIMIILLLIGLYIYKVVKEKKIVLPHGNVFIFILVAHMAMTFFWAENKVPYDDSFLMILLLYLIVPTFIKNHQELKHVMTSYLISSIIYSIHVIYYLNINDITSNISASINRNYACLYIISSLIISVVFFQLYQKEISIILKIAFCMNIIACLYIMIMFASRSAFIILIVFFILFFILSKSVKIKMLYLIILVIALLLVLQFGVGEYLLERFTRDDIYTANGRTVIQGELLDKYFNSDIFHMILGYGFNNIKTDNGFTAHNSYVSIILSFGLIGILTFVFYILNLIINLFNKRYSLFTIVIIS